MSENAVVSVSQIHQAISSMNAISLIARMEAELTQLRNLAVLRGRRYDGALRRLNQMENTLLMLFEMRLQLMEELVFTPDPAISNNAIASRPSRTYSPTHATEGQYIQLSMSPGAREIEEDLIFLKTRINRLQSRFRAWGPYRMIKPCPPTQRRHSPGPYADIIRRELERISEADRATGSGAENNEYEDSQLRLEESELAICPAKKSRTALKSANCQRSKFTC